MAKHIEEERAKWALETIRSLEAQVDDAKKEKQCKELLSHIRKLPSHIQTSGLAQTLLFYGNKQEKIAKALAKHLGLLAGDKESIADAVRKLVANAETVRQKTRAALTAAQWLKRFAEVELRLEKNGSSRSHA